MRRTIAGLGLIFLLLGAGYADEAPAPAKPDPVQQDAELRRLLARVQSSVASEQLAQFKLDALLETKTEAHPKVQVARNELEEAKRQSAVALRAYQDARKAKGLSAAAPIPKPNGGQAALIAARAELESARARLRLLLDRRAVVEDELRGLRASKTDQHPKVRGAMARKALLDAQVTEVQARIARDQEQVRFLERQQGSAASGLPALEAKIDALQNDVRGLRTQVAELKALIQKLLPK